MSLQSVGTAGNDDGAVVVQCIEARAPLTRSLLSLACRATGVAVRLEVVGGTGGLFRSLHSSGAIPLADLIISQGPYLATVATQAKLLQPYRPAGWPPPGIPDPLVGATHHPEWYWVAIDFQPMVLAGEPRIGAFEAVSEVSVPRLAVPDPLQSEVGHLALLSMHHRADRLGYDPWGWWERRAEAGMVLTEDLQGALEAVRAGRASHALGLASPAATEAGGVPLQGVAPMPNAVALVRGAPHAKSAQRLLDWLLGPEAAEHIDQSGQGGLSTWKAESNGLRRLMEQAPPLDVEWTAGRFLSVRERWAGEKRFSEWPFQAR